MRHVPLLLVALLVFGCDPMAPVDNTKESAAAAKAEKLQLFAKSHAAKCDGKLLDDLDELVRYAEEGEKAVTDPWGQKFQFAYVSDSEMHGERLVIWTVEPKSGRVIAAPRHLAHLVEPPK